MSKNVIYCFSGSGNCLDIAKNIAKGLGDTDIIMMRGYPAVTEVSDAEKVGFVFPCHAGGLPGNVEQYVSNIHIAPDAYKFAVVSYSGYPGIGLSKINDIVGLDYWAGVSHNCSCIWLFPHKLMMPLMPTVGAAQKRSEKLTAMITQNIIEKKKSEKNRPSAPVVNKLESKAWPVLKSVKGKKLSVSDDCIGCGQCEKLCPVGNIRIENERPVFSNKCVQCLSCIQYCPKKAINMGGITLKRERYHNPNICAAELMKPVIHID